MYTTGESNEARANILDVRALSSKHLICTCFLFLRRFAYLYVLESTSFFKSRIYEMYRVSIVRKSLAICAVVRLINDFFL